MTRLNNGGKPPHRSSVGKIDDTVRSPRQLQAILATDVCQEPERMAARHSCGLRTTNPDNHKHQGLEVYPAPSTADATR